MGSQHFRIRAPLRYKAECFTLTDVFWKRNFPFECGSRGGKLPTVKNHPHCLSLQTWPIYFLMAHFPGKFFCQVSSLMFQCSLTTVLQLLMSLKVHLLIGTTICTLYSYYRWNPKAIYLTNTLSNGWTSSESGLDPTKRKSTLLQYFWGKKVTSQEPWCSPLWHIHNRTYLFARDVIYKDLLHLVCLIAQDLLECYYDQNGYDQQHCKIFQTREQVCPPVSMSISFICRGCPLCALESAIDHVFFRIECSQASDPIIPEQYTACLYKEKVLYITLFMVKDLMPPSVACSQYPYRLLG